MLSLDENVIIPFLVFSIPIIAIVGGITAGIVRTLGRQRLVELAQRERIAAIERGIDPSKLPSAPTLVDDSSGFGMFGPRTARHRAQGLLIGGIITMFAGVGIAAFLLVMRSAGTIDEPVWAVGLIPGFVGLAMLISAWLVWPRGQNGA
jgi:hypothetical protein